MFCPRCGFSISDDLKFCRQCGANLLRVREALVSRSADDKSGQNHNWLADLVSAGAELKQRIEGTPEEKRINEIKGGVVTCFVGIGLSIFLYFFLDVVAQQKSPNDAEIVRHIWYVGIIPFLIGLGLIFNGLFLTRRLMKLKEQQSQPAQPAQPAQSVLPASPMPIALPAKTTDQLVIETTPSPVFSVSEDTTAHLPDSAAAPLHRENS